MFMFARILAVSLLGLLTLTHAASGAVLTAKLSRPSVYGGRHGGGEFLAKVYEDGVLIGEIETYCLEFSEHIQLGTTYYASIDPIAVRGGGGALGTAPNTYDPLGQQTAWLYAKYVANELDSMVTGTVSLGEFKNGFQKAVWNLEQEPFTTSGYTSDENTVFNSLLALAAGSGYSGDIGPLGFEYIVPLGPDSERVYTVSVLNLYQDAAMTMPHQSQLYYTVFERPRAPGDLPEPMTLAMWSGLSILGLGMARRHRRKESA
ncbi:MAG: hypothetical protein MUF06_14770 [Pirellulaceae bacterium]|nr:hypothetical protein [Pirellulaceae bacterium]